jgi:hypothetical protein
MEFLFDAYDGKVTELDKELQKRDRFYEKTAEKILAYLKPTHIFETVSLDTTTGEEVTSKFLTKSGARYLCKLFDLRPDFQTDHKFMPNGDVNFLASCTIKSKDGDVLAIGEAEQSLFMYRNPNTAKKMARKSALVDAVVMLFGLDDYFHQDEDYQRKLDMQVLNPSMVSGGQAYISVEFVQSLARQKGVRESQILTRYGVRSFDLLTAAQLQEIVEVLNNRPDIQPNKPNIAEQTGENHATH